MSLMSKVKRGVTKTPPRIVVYGPEGIGKTTFAAGAPDAVFVGTEDGGGDLDLTRVDAPARWRDVRDTVTALLNEDHPFRTVVLDTLDHLEALCWRHVCDRNHADSIEEVGGGYGKGYIYAVTEWRELVDDLDKLRTQRGMMVIALAHADVKTWKNPEGTDFDRWQLRMHQKSAALWKEWCDCLLFANYDIDIKTQKRGDKALFDKGKAVNGARKLHTERGPAFDAKNRYSLPAEMPLRWDAFARAAKVDERLPALEPEFDEDGHHKTWAADQKRFFAALGKLDLGVSYEDLAAWCEAKPLPRPSAMTQEKRDGLLKGLANPDNADKVRAWVSENRPAAEQGGAA